MFKATFVKITLFGCYSNIKGKFSKKIFKHLLLRSRMGDEGEI